VLDDVNACCKQCSMQAGRQAGSRDRANHIVGAGGRGSSVYLRAGGRGSSVYLRAGGRGCAICLRQAGIQEMGKKRIFNLYLRMILVSNPNTCWECFLKARHMVR
jgi:hypothetical protein